MCGCGRLRARPGTFARKVQNWLLLNIFIVSPVFKHLNRSSLGRLGCPAFTQLSALRPGLNSTGLEVITVHPGRMGSSSVALALESLGMRTYGPSDLFSYSTYMASEGPIPAYFVGVFSACKVKAFNADDWYNLLPDLVAVSPGVKILHLKRDWGRWARPVDSMQVDVVATILYHLLTRFLFCNWLPYGLVWPAEGLGSSLMTPSTTAVLFSHCFRAVDDIYAAIGIPRQYQMANDRAFFERTRVNVTKLVPSTHILDFDVKRHGWSELAAFVGREPPPKGTPFPRAKRSGQLRISMMWSLFPREHLTFVALMLPCMIANWLCFLGASALWRRAFARPGGDAKAKAA
uniref:Uncharacterized protein n=1 Tax=Alexandrium catenella TaxID=2925 RepID=A0A7S1QRH4_ALECA|mmetsp:Transcript_37164/g.100582  ORF Transcript_37164/g.100582 Transcript_37164/m.100582 type:complete len:347 (+) Transcript_37164:123-1163(+)